MKKPSMKKLLFVATGSLAVLGVAAGLVAAPLVANATTVNVTTINAMYGIDNGGSPGSPLYSIDPATGTTTAVGSAISGLTNASSLAYAPDGSLKILQKQGSACELWTVNPSDGTGSKEYDISGYGGTFFDCWGMTIALDGIMYIGYRNVSEPAQLAKVDLSTGVIIDTWPVDSESSGSVNFIAEDPSNGRIYYQSDNKNNLYYYDPGTDSTTQVTFRSTGSSLTPFYGAAQTLDGQLFVSLWGAMGTLSGWSDFENYNSGTGAIPYTSLNGSTSGNLSGIAFQVDFPVPTPDPVAPELASTGNNALGYVIAATMALLVIGVGSLLVTMRRRRS